jgi:hypothetical protein
LNFQGVLSGVEAFAEMWRLQGFAAANSGHLPHSGQVCGLSVDLESAGAALTQTGLAAIREPATFERVITDETPKVAPLESCIACSDGDTRTVVLIEGEAEWHIAALMRLVGITQTEASGIFRAYFGCGPGMVPRVRVACSFRLCRDCADKTGARVTGIGQPSFRYAQS